MVAGVCRSSALCRHCRYLIAGSVFAALVLFFPSASLCASDSGFRAPHSQLVFEPAPGSEGGTAFIARGRGLLVRLEPGAMLFMAPQRSLADSEPAALTVRLELVNASGTTRLVALEQQAGRSNYFIGSEPEGWRTDVPRYARLKYEGIYPGIDLVLHGSGGALEYEFHLSPGARLDAVELRFEGAERVAIDEHGDLAATGASGTVTHKRPTVFVGQGPQSREVQGRYTEHRGTFSLAVAESSADEELTMDPVVVASTYLGGDRDDISYAMTVDAQGAIYITGSTSSTNFPVRSPYQRDQFGEDVFVTKLDATASQVIYSTYLGSKSTERQNYPYEAGYAIAVDAMGNAYVTGSTGECGFPTTAGAFQRVCQPSAGRDIFVTKLGPGGNALLYSTYVHGRAGGSEYPSAMALDAAGRVYLAGTTDVGSFPVTSGAFQRNKGAGNEGFAGSNDGFIAVMNPAGSALDYATFLGGRLDDRIKAMVIDDQGAVYVAGDTFSPDFPTKNAYQSASGGSTDAFVARLNPVLSTLEYSSFLGGAKFDDATAIACDAEGNVFIGGSTNSTNFPLVRPFQRTLGGEYDVFLAKLNRDGTALAYSTYIGGRADEGFINGVALAVEPDGKAYLTGSTRSANFPVIRGVQTKLAGKYDGFLSKFSAEGAVLFSTFLGGTADDTGRAVAVGPSSRVYVAGDTVSADFPVVSALQPAHAPEVFAGIYSDTFLVLLDIPPVHRRRSIRR